MAAICKQTADIFHNFREVNPHLFTIATLTGHARLSVGPYTAIMDNGVAKKDGFALSLQATGEQYGDMFEVR